MGFDQKELARRAIVSTSSVSLIEGNKKSPTVSMVVALARGLNVSPRELLSDGGIVAPWELVAAQLDLRLAEVRELRAALTDEGRDLATADADTVRDLVRRIRASAG